MFQRDKSYYDKTFVLTKFNVENLEFEIDFKKKYSNTEIYKILEEKRTSQKKTNIIKYVWSEVNLKYWKENNAEMYVWIRGSLNEPMSVYRNKAWYSASLSGSFPTCYNNEKYKHSLSIVYKKENDKFILCDNRSKVKWEEVDFVEMKSGTEAMKYLSGGLLKYMYANESEQKEILERAQVLIDHWNIPFSIDVFLDFADRLKTKEDHIRWYEH